MRTPLNQLLFCVLFFVGLGFLTSCSPKISKLTIENESLFSLNKNAIDGIIANPEKESWIRFGFSDNTKKTINEKPLALVCKVTSLQENKLTRNPNIALCFLYEKDTKIISPRETVKGSFQDTITISFEIPRATEQKITGFALYADMPVQLLSISLSSVAYGWEDFNPTYQSPWYGYGISGGVFPTDKSFDFTTFSEPYDSNMEYSILLTDNPGEQGELGAQNRVVLNLSGNQITIRRVKGQKSVLLNGGQFSVPSGKCFIEKNPEMVTGITLQAKTNLSNIKNKEGKKVLNPIVADPGLITNWPQESWRQEDFEFFSWQQFPSILFFDCKDYRIQDYFFKRLAFFVEKSGYVGTLVTDKEVAHQHGFNAHDYRAESLAAFFNKAEKEQFLLNSYELLLKDILLAQEIICRSGSDIIPGQGAIISISKESPEYLRTTFIAHEGLHGMYFTDEAFRSTVAAVYTMMDSRSLAFLTRYFEYTPTLNYDTSDTYLMHNELMAYLLQQQVYRIPAYFAENLAIRKSVNDNEPELAQYVRETNAQGFVDAATILEEYLYQRWGFAAGRVSLVFRD